MHPDTQTILDTGKKSGYPKNNCPNSKTTFWPAPKKSTPPPPPKMLFPTP